MRSIPAKSSVPANIGLVLAGAARDAVVAALAQAGYEVHVAANISRVRSLLARNTVDAWIFDARADDVLDLLLTTDCFLLPADNIPDTAAEQGFLAVGRGLDNAAGGRAVGQCHTVWSRAAGSVARGARRLAVGRLGRRHRRHSDLSQCLQRSHRPWPLSMPSIWIPPSSISCSVLRLQNKQFSLSIAGSVQTLAPARLVMISPRYTVALNEFGQLTTTRQEWSGQHTPDINELLVILSAAKLPAAGRHHLQRHGQ